MDAKMAREQLRELHDALGKLDEERDVYLSLINGYEGFLRLHGEGRSPLPPASKVAPRESGSHTPQGKLSLRQAVLQVLTEAHPHPVHVKEILARVTAMGAVTNAKSPEKVIDLVAYNLKTRSGKPIERVSPRSWRYTELGPRPM
jgi:hypothetical protein